jgi:hypothetical protein
LLHHPIRRATGAHHFHAATEEMAFESHSTTSPEFYTKIFRHVVPGDLVVVRTFLADGTTPHFHTSEVLRVEDVHDNGAFSPQLSNNGMLVVDNVVANAGIGNTRDLTEYVPRDDLYNAAALAGYYYLLAGVEQSFGTGPATECDGQIMYGRAQLEKEGLDYETYKCQREGTRLEDLPSGFSPLTTTKRADKDIMKAQLPDRRNVNWPVVVAQIKSRIAAGETFGPMDTLEVVKANYFDANFGELLHPQFARS